MDQSTKFEDLITAHALTVVFDCASWKNVLVKGKFIFTIQTRDLKYISCSLLMRSLLKNSYKKYRQFYIVIFRVTFIIDDVNANIRTFYTI